MVGGKGNSLAAQDKICSNKGKNTRDGNMVNPCRCMCLFRCLQDGSKVRIQGRFTG